MSHARAVLLAIGAGALLVAAACGSSDSSDAYGGSSSSSGGSSSGGSTSPSVDAGAQSIGPTANGVLLLHGAAFPAFRLCFENSPGAAPLPDATVMPEANVVGVEIGSLVRLPPMTAPGTIYVLRESAVRSTPGETNTPTCGELVASTPDQKTDKTLIKDIDYHVVTGLDHALGQSKAAVLAITGCGSQALLTSLGLSSAGCGAGWDATSGNLQARAFELTANTRADDHLPVQLFQMSQALDTLAADGGSLSVRFGDLTSDAGPLSQQVDTGELFAGGPQKYLTFDQTKPSTYGSWGFRVTAGAGAAAFSLDQSLAAVQELSSPRELPTNYYRAASNYALLLLGDPAHKPTLADGGVNTLFNPRESVHILAVPVVDPSTSDAGVDVAGPSSDTNR